MERWRDQLQAKRQAVISKPCWNAHRWHTGKAGGHGEDIVQIHGHRIGDFLADREGRRWGCWGQQQINLFKGIDKVILNQAAGFLCLQVIGIIIACGQHISADQNTAGDFITKSSRPGFGIHIIKAFTFDTLAIFNAIIARQIR